MTTALRSEQTSLLEMLKFVEYYCGILKTLDTMCHLKGMQYSATGHFSGLTEVVVF